MRQMPAAIATQHENTARFTGMPNLVYAPGHACCARLHLHRPVLRHGEGLTAAPYSVPAFPTVQPPRTIRSPRKRNPLLPRHFFQERCAWGGATLLSGAPSHRLGVEDGEWQVTNKE